MVFEPLWTLIPSNKAILPVLWSLFPDHPYLLDTTFELTDTLRAKGFVKKPIVGRCGRNVSIFDSSEGLIEATDGLFGDRDQIYQEFFPLARTGELYSAVRVDESRVINAVAVRAVQRVGRHVPSMRASR